MGVLAERAPWLIRLAAAAAIGSPASASEAAAVPPRVAELICDVRDFGAKGDGRTLDTRAIQAAVDICGGRGGTVYFGPGRYVSGTVYFGPGRYVSGTVGLKSHMTFKLGRGAVLSGSHDIKDYWPSSRIGLGHTYGTDIAGEGQLTGLLVGKDITDLGVEGPGIIDGQSDAFMSQTIHNSRDYAPEAVRNPSAFELAMTDREYGPLEPVASGRPGVLLLLFHAKDVTLSGINFRDSPNWTLVLQDVERATISGFTIVNNPLMPNNDGIDCMACRNVHIHDGAIRTGDDDIVLVNGEDVTVSGVSMYSRSAAVRLESTQRAVLNNLTIESNRGLAIFASRQISRPTDGVIFSNIVMRTRLMLGHWWGKAEPIYISTQRCERTCAGGVRNVVFSDIEADAEAGMTIGGVAGQEVSNVLMRNIRLRMIPPPARLAAAIGGNFDRRWTASVPAEGIVKHDIPAIYCEFTRGLELRDVDIVWAERMPAYSTGALGCEHSQGLILNGVSELGRPPSGKPLQLLDTKIERIERIHLRQ